MIEVLIDHSYEDDYFMISRISVNIKDPVEKERIEKLASQLEGAFVDPGGGLRKRIAEHLGVDPDIIDIDTNEIDLF